ncbi:E-selectin-like [Pseudophryne corroboree]|uniref:E-selectin-like n=1 Tax=Pseudophryne corroboree TaxID=495146 RepID=UPI00308125AA
MCETRLKMKPIQVLDIESKDIGKWKSLRLLCIAAVSCGLLKSTEVSAWTYEFGSDIMTWKKAYDYCEKKFTGMVVIQSNEESSFLKDKLQPVVANHYWIGIRKHDQDWRREGTNISQTLDVEYWAPGEPNNKNNAQKCVEIYLGRHKYSGKWNDENCEKEKRALCYLVSCQDSSCNHHGECVETPGNYTCKCWPGFRGANCENAVSCMAPERPEHGHINCTDVFGEFQYKSICRFSCDEGFEIKGSKSLLCQNSGEWSEFAPTCLAVSCMALQRPEHGQINCSEAFEKLQYSAMCNFSCEEGFELKGSKSLLCQNSGEWSESAPTCSAVSCMALQRPEHGNIHCSDAYGKFLYSSICNFSCAEGFELKGSKSLLCQNTGEWSGFVPTCLAGSCMALQIPEHGQINCSDVYGEFQYDSICNFTCNEGFEVNGSNSLLCQNSREWSDSTPTCLAQNISPGKQHQFAIVGSSLAATGLTLSGIIAFSINHFRKKRNPSLLAPHKHPANTFDNPAFEEKDISSFDL